MLDLRDDEISGIVKINQMMRSMGSLRALSLLSRESGIVESVDS